MRNSAARLVALVAVVLLLLAGAAAWRLLESDERDGAPDVSRSPTSSAAEPMTTLPVPEAAPADVAPLASEASALPAPPPPDNVASARPLPGVTVGFTGRVVQGGVPVAGATVLYRGTAPLREALRAGADPGRTDLELMPRTLTDGDGRFALDSRFLPGEAWDWDEAYPFLIVLAKGCAPRSVRCVGCTGGAFDAGDVCIERGGWLTGRAVEETGLPLAGATVAVQNAKSSSTDCALDHKSDFDHDLTECTRTVSAVDGRFRAGPFWPGTVMLHVSAPERLEASVDERAIEPGADVDVGDVVLGAGLTLSGDVIDSAGAPVPGALLHAWKPHGVDGLHEAGEWSDVVAFRRLRVRRSADTRADATGHFALHGLVASNYALSVEAEGFEWAIVDDLMPGLRPVEVNVVPAARLELSVLSDADEAPCTAATIEAARLFGSRNAGVPLAVRAGGTPGLYVIEPLGPGGTDVLVSAPDFGGASLHLDGVKPGEVQHQTLRLPALTILGGRVSDVGGAPLPAVEVVASWAPPESAPPAPHPASAKAVTTADGRFELRGLQPGEWSLSADDAEHLSSARPVTVTPGLRAADLDLVLSPSGAIWGMVTDADSLPRVGTRLYAQLSAAEGGPPPRHIEAYSDVAGRYEFPDLEPGNWQVGDQETTDVLLAAGERRRLDLQQGAKTVLAGRVLDADGRPAPDAVLFFAQAEEGLSGLQRTPMPAGADGTFRNEWVQPGPCSVQAVLEDGGGQTPPVTVQVIEHQTISVDLHVGAERAQLHVTDSASGKAVAGVRVALVALREDGETLGYARLRLNGRKRNFGGTSDADGFVRLAGLSPGQFKVVIADAGFSLATDPAPIVELHAGELATAELTVAATARITGKAHDSKAVPVRDGVYVSAFGPGEGDTALAVTRSGEFSLEGLRPGTWRLFVGELPAERAGSSGGKVLAERTVTLQPGQVLELDVTVNG